MNFIKKLFSSNKAPERIRITQENIDNWPTFQKRLDEGFVKFDAKGRLRYQHGAPVGDMILYSTHKGGTPKYKESAVEWFDPDSPKAREFQWPT